MNILFAASEAAPFAKTGGLADVAGSLPQALAALGHDVSLVIPRYRQVDIAARRLRHIGTFSVPLGHWNERCDVLQGRLGKSVTTYFIEKKIFFDRPELYGTGQGDYADNAERFIFFSRAIAELCLHLDLRPAVVHCNDWQTGLVPLYVKSMYRNTSSLGKTRTIFTIHNLGYQGLFPHRDLRLTGFGEEVFTPEGMEFWGELNLMKAGIVYADAVTTVSKTYSREIQTPEYGYGLEGVLKNRSNDLFGIVNGIDTTIMNPARDRLLSKTYSASRPAGKTACKQALRQQLGLPQNNEPLAGMVTRLADQKGFDILTEALPEILTMGIQVVILGTGDPKYHRMLSDMAARHADHMRVLLQYNDGIARNIYAASDLFLMPSRYEPCGLGQLHALRYGSVPVARKTGGLADTIIDEAEHPGRGTGFLFSEYSAVALSACIRHAVDAYGSGPKWQQLMLRGMNMDFSWGQSAKEYAAVYRKAHESMQKPLPESGIA